MWVCCGRPVLWSYSIVARCVPTPTLRSSCGNWTRTSPCTMKLGAGRKCLRAPCAATDGCVSCATSLRYVTRELRVFVVGVGCGVEAGSKGRAYCGAGASRCKWCTSCLAPSPPPPKWLHHFLYSKLCSCHAKWCGLGCDRFSSLIMCATPFFVGMSCGHTDTAVAGGDHTRALWPTPTSGICPQDLHRGEPHTQEVLPPTLPQSSWPWFASSLPLVGFGGRLMWLFPLPIPPLVVCADAAPRP